MYFDQQPWDVRFEWGEEGFKALKPVCDVLVIVDVLSFSTCLCLAVERGASVHPCPYKDATAAVYAESIGAFCAAARNDPSSPYSLSPDSMRALPEGSRLVLPSPNGAALSLLAEGKPTFAGCLRNAEAVARTATRAGATIGVIAAGERWRGGGLRPALEDALGAGAIIHSLEGPRSPEATAAEALFLRFEAELADTLRRCSSGRQLIEMGFPQDVDGAAELNVSQAVPVLRNGAYVRAGE